MSKIEGSDLIKKFIYSSCCKSMAQFALSDTYRKDDNILFSTQNDVMFLGNLTCPHTWRSLVHDWFSVLIKQLTQANFSPSKVVP